MGWTIELSATGNICSAEGPRTRCRSAGLGLRRLNERVWIGVGMMEEGLGMKVRKLVIWKVLEVLS